MHRHRSPDLAALLFALAVCAAFGGLFAWVLAIPFWLGMAMVGAALVVVGVQRHDGRAPRRREALRHAPARAFR
ncbi:MAG: hypothetical protein ACK5VV_13515 [Lysobacteraceae bacterium]|jgi:hypothetical protein|nr:hypothetical protein [Silanimonas sp.]